MASETEVWPQSPAYRAPWPPDDTEESVVGTNLHQKTIINLRWGINEVARMRMQAESSQSVLPVPRSSAASISSRWPRQCSVRSSSGRRPSA